MIFFQHKMETIAMVWIQQILKFMIDDLYDGARHEHNDAISRW